MTFKIVLFFASALFVQSISGRCLTVAPSSRGSGSGIVSGDSCKNGGAFIVQCIGPIVPRGISAATDSLSLSGNLSVDGSLPFLSAVAFDGHFPSAGTAAVSYACGDDCVGIKEEIGCVRQ